MRPLRLRTSTQPRAVATLLLLCGVGSALQSQQLDEVLRQHVDELASPGAVVAVLRNGELSTFTSGWRGEAQSEPIEADDRLRFGSVSKLFLAVVLLQLVEEGRLDLDAPIASYVDGVPQGERISLRMLGGHRSGLTDPIRHLPFHVRLAADPQHLWTSEELLDFTFAQEQAAEPGEKFSYSNINSTLLSRVVEKVTGRSYREEIRRRILEPLGLQTIGFTHSGSPSVKPSVRGYRHGRAKDPVGYGDVWFDASEWSDSWAGAGAGIAGTAADLARFVEGLFGGDLVSAGALETLRGEGDYGFQCMRVDTPLGPAWGHNGDVPGYSASAFYIPQTRTALAVLANLSNEKDGSSPASKIRDALFEALATKN
ncbi:MAG: serine hydrolase domain-containing protein [Acidobacteriota bacterium]